MYQEPESFDTHCVVTLSKGPRTIRLYGVSHVATAEFYRMVADMLRQDIHDGAVVHHEGLSGVPDRYSLSDMYRRLAELLQLANQKDHLTAVVPGVDKDLSWDDLGRVNRFRLKSIYQLMDGLIYGIANKSEEERQEYRDRMTGSLRESKSTQMSTVAKVAMGEGLTHDRSRYAAGEALAEDRDVSMVWGRKHLPEIVQVLVKGGFTVSDHQPIDPRR